MSPAVVNRPLSVALVGFGEMGQNHARCLASMKEVDLVAVVDPDEDRRNLAAARYECESFSSATELPEVGAAVVAVPTAQHSDVGCFLMKRGVHCLIEKPLALDRAEAEADVATTTCPLLVLVEDDAEGRVAAGVDEVARERDGGAEAVGAGGVDLGDGRLLTADGVADDVLGLLEDLQHVVVALNSACPNAA